MNSKAGFSTSRFRILVCCLITVSLSGESRSQPTADLVLQRQQFQALEQTCAKFGSWVFQVGTTPKLVWRDFESRQQFGGDTSLPIQWFDAQLVEHAQPDAPGRWMAWVEGQAPNGTPFRRSYTFFAFPKKIDNQFVPDLTVEFPNFPGPDTPAAWKEHQSEFDRLGKDMMIRALLDSEKGSILMAGIAESKELGRPKRYVESTSVVNDQMHLALKLKKLGDRINVNPLRPPVIREVPAPVLRKQSPQHAGVPADAKVKIDQFCQDWAEATGEPFVTLVARRGVIVTHRAFGNDEDGHPIDVDYRCWVASITKTITALMFSQFVDQQLIEWDASIATVFPDFPDDEHVPTFRQCLNHTSGLAGPGDFGGMKNPHLENVILNGIDVNQPGKTFAYTGMGFEIVAKAMELVSGKCAARIYDEHLFRPLGFGDVVLGNASSAGEFTALELGILAQWVANQGSYGKLEFIRPTTFSELLPKPLGLSQLNEDKGLGLNWVRHRRPGADINSMQPEDLLFSPNSVGHGSFSGCIFFVDFDQQLVIAQARRRFSKDDDAWYARFFQTVAAAIEADPAIEE